MNDKTILNHINDLVEEENRLRDAGIGSDDAAAKLRHVEEELDQAWDLLRQRRAKREFGANPDDATPRDPKVVENYEN
ncbi:MAG: DUF2630 family protein [Comamonadaceae bacterium]|nr:MAG: DUF2630 family protein [Comamonadaceae bacterium]